MTWAMYNWPTPSSFRFTYVKGGAGNLYLESQICYAKDVDSLCVLYSFTEIV